MPKKKINTKDLVSRIEQITKERMAKEKVVSLKEFHAIEKDNDPYTILIIEDDENHSKSHDPNV